MKTTNKGRDTLTKKEQNDLILASEEYNDEILDEENIDDKMNKLFDELVTFGNKLSKEMEWEEVKEHPEYIKIKQKIKEVKEKFYS